MKKASTLLLILFLGMTACKKEVTETKVEQVNQAFSITASIPADAWSTPDDGYSYNASIDIPEMEDMPIYEHGAVLVYLQFPGQDFYTALPEVFMGNTYGVLHNAGAVTVDMSDALGELTVTPPTESISAKVIWINAQLLALHPDVNLQDYHAVKQAFKVK